MVVAAAVLLVAAAVLGVLLARARARVGELGEELARAQRSAADADAARRAAEGERATAQRERDDALERERRIKREAADVARRLQGEHTARREVEEARDRLVAEVAELRSAAAQRPEDEAELWALALAGVRRTWEISVAPSPGLPSPLEEAVDPLRAAIEIEVDAAREEAGAAIDLEWAGEALHPPSVSLRALSIVQELVGRLAKVSETAVLRVHSAPDSIAVEVEASDAGGASVVPGDVAVEHQVAPGRYVLSRCATSARPGT